MPITSSSDAKMLAYSDLIRDMWNAGNRKRTLAMIRQAAPVTLRFLRVRSSVHAELKLAVDREQYRRATEP